MKKRSIFLSICTLLFISFLATSPTYGHNNDGKAYIIGKLVNLPAPQNLVVTSTTASTIATEWDAVPGAVSYRIRTYKTSNGNLVQTKYTTNLNSVSDNLEDNTEYMMEVVGVEPGGDYDDNTLAMVTAITDFVVDIVINTYAPSSLPFNTPVGNNSAVVIPRNCSSYCKVVETATQQQTEFEMTVDNSSINSEIDFKPDEQDAGFLTHLTDGAENCNTATEGVVKIVECLDNTLMSYAIFKVFEEGGQVKFGVAELKSGYTVHLAICTPPIKGREDNDDFAPEVALQARPNPFNEHLDLITSGKEPVQVQIMDLSGRIWVEKTITDANATIDTQALPNGAYMVKMVSSEEVKSIKVIKTGL